MTAEYVCCSLTSQKQMNSYNSQSNLMDSYDSQSNIMDSYDSQSHATKLPRGHTILL